MKWSYFYQQMPKAVLPKPWTYKYSSVTFYVQDSHKVSQPMTLDVLSYEMTSHLNKLIDEFGYNREDYLKEFAPDGESWNDFTGTMNYYIPETADLHVARQLIRKLLQDLPPGISGDMGPIETSNLHGTNVMRISITENETENRQQIPDVNMTNANTSAILKLLGIPNEPHGQIEAKDLLRRIKSAYDNIPSATRPDQDYYTRKSTPEEIAEAEEQERQMEYEKEQESIFKQDNPWAEQEKQQDAQMELENLLHPPAAEEGEPRGPRVIDFGRDEDYIWRKLNELEELALFAIKFQHNPNQPATIYWA